MVTQPDEVTQEQEALDGQQDIAQQPEFVTQAELKGYFQSMERMVNGLQSKIDKGLNSIRADSQTQRSQLEQAGAQADFEKVVSAAPPETQEALRVLWRQNQQRSVVTPVEPVTESGTQLATWWEGMRSFVTQMGLDPNDSRINYAALLDQTKTQQQQLVDFGASIKAALGTGPAQGVKPRVATNQRRANEGNPPVTTPKAPAGYQNGYDVLGAYTEGKLTKEQARDQLQKLDPELLPVLGG